MNHRLTNALLLAATTAVLIAPSASAATVSGTPAEHDATAAVHIASGQTEWLGRFFVNAEEQAKPGGRERILPEVSTEAALAKAPRVDGTARAVHMVSADFIRSATPTETVAEFAHFAVPATSATGQKASMWVARGENGEWLVENITTGMEDITLSDRGVVFTEPQINAWYELRGDTVIALNQEARTSIGESATVAAYHGMVHARYADKLPGTDYADQKMLGGYSPQSHSIAGDPGTGDAPLWWAALGVVTLIGGSVFVYRRTTARV